MDATLYQPIFLTLISMLCVGYSLRYVSSSDYHLQLQSGGWLVPFVLSVVLVFWLGLRPVSYVFGDTVNYAAEYERLQPGIISMDWSREWIWQWLMHGCKAAGLSVNIFFLIVEAGYILTAFWAVRRFFPTNPLIGMLFVFSSLMFFTFGTNGLRNGLACHIVLLAISYLYDAKYVVGVLLCLLAFGIHRSVILPIAASVGGMFLAKQPKWALYFWFASIAISLVAGGAVTNFFASLGFDDRMTDYTLGDNDMGQFSRTGFRWDFLIYSAFPVLLDGRINTFISVENGKFTAKLLFQLIQYNGLIPRADITVEFISQHICGINALLFQHPHGQVIKHGDTDADYHRHA